MINTPNRGTSLIAIRETFSRQWARASSESNEPISPNPQGHVALMLCESILHVLVERGVITKATGIEVIETVRDATHEMADDDPSAPNRTAAILAMEILQSFEAK
jgi:hypothetical protein